MRTLLLLSLPVLLAAQAPRRSAPDGALLAVSDGGGKVRLLVWPPQNTPPPAGGWQVLDEGGRVLVPRLQAGDPEALKTLPPEQALEAGRLAGQLVSEKDPGRRRLMALQMLVEAGNDLAMGRALGMAVALGDQPMGRRAYTVVGLDATGKAAGPRLASPQVDPAAMTPFPKAPRGLRAEAGRESVRLYWQPVDGGEVPVVDYRVARGETVLTQQPLVLGVWDTAKPAFEDREAPGDAAHEYRVWAVDVFGRRSPDVAAGVFFPDPATLRPPAALAVLPEPGLNLLTFQPSPTKRSAGTLVERAFAPTGPFQLLTPRPLPVGTSRFEDASVGGGATYHYRLRTVDADGNIGDPSPTRHAVAVSKGQPRAPSGLKVDGNPVGNVLTWQGPDTPVAGYLVERKVGEGEWTRLGSQLVKGSRHEDALTEDVSGALSYRVSTITFDNLASAPCAAVTVERASRELPAAPVILGIDGGEGKVILQFRPAAPEARTAQFLVLRSVKQEGGYGLELVVGDPLPAQAREHVDPWVDPGATYRYRLVALSPEGQRSALSEGVETRVAPPAVPEPPVPTVTLQTTPYRHVVVKLGAVPEGFRAYLHRKAPGERVWTEIQGPFVEAEVVDPRPVRGKVQYRIHLEVPGGLAGRSGAPVEIDIR